MCDFPVNMMLNYIKNTHSNDDKISENLKIEMKKLFSCFSHEIKNLKKLLLLMLNSNNILTKKSFYIKVLADFFNYFKHSFSLMRV